MRVEILEYFPEKKNNTIGFFDVKVTYTEDKWEIFRNLSVYEGRGRRNISFGSVKRGEKWAPRFERYPYPNELFTECLKELERLGKFSL